MTALPLLARLRQAYPESSGRTLRQWLAAGRVHVNGRVVKDARATVAPGDAVLLGAEGHARVPAPLRLVHEDDDLLVVEKPPGLLTIATERERQRTAYRLVWEYLARSRPPRRPFIVHRLDRDTSGLLVLAKSPEAKRRLQAQFAARRVERAYLAVVEGQPRAEGGTIESRLEGRDAVTHYRVVARGRDASVLEIRLGTGRRHQIRLHLAELGHPIVGDRARGSRRDPIGRLCLHATRLAFVHPVTGAPLAFESPPPAAFRRLGARAGRRGVDWTRCGSRAPSS